MMSSYTRFILTVCLVAFGIGSAQAGICRGLTIDGCRCFKEVKWNGVHFNESTTRHVPVPCEMPCDLYLSCDGLDDQLKKGAPCSGLTVISRQQWGAQNPRGPVGVISNPVDQFYIHHTAGRECNDLKSCAVVLRSIQAYHFSKGWSDIAYSFLVGDDGHIYEGRGWNKEGSHTEGYNSVSYAVSFMGMYMTKLPYNKAMTAVKQLIVCGIQLGKIQPVYSLYGHRDADGDTLCPGDDLYKEIHGWAYYNRTINPSAGCVAKGRRCKQDPSTCKPGSLIVGPNLCKGGNKNCCYKP